jgi:hypothetical protein
MSALRDLLSADAVSLQELQAAVFAGCPDSLRGAAWKLLLGYYPTTRSERAAAVDKRRLEYEQILSDATSPPPPPKAPAAAAAAAAAAPAPALPCELSTSNLFGSPSKVGRLHPSVHDLDSLLGAGAGAPAAPEGGGAGGGSAAPAPALPLVPPESPPPPSPPPPEQPCLQAADAELRREIEKDVERTHSELSFFSQPAHTAAMARILFVFAKCNSGVRYIQGMNELLAPLLYVCVTEGSSSAGGRGGSVAGVPTPAPLPLAEADAFFLFSALMQHHRDVFMQSQDDSASGIKAQLARFERALARREPAVAAHLAQLKIVPQFYALGWLTTLCCQDLNLHDAMMLWDKLLADAPSTAFLLCFCVACIRTQRGKVLAADFGPAMRLLRTPPPVDFQALLAAAMGVRSEELAEGFGSAAAGAGTSATSPLGGGSGGGSGGGGGGRGSFSRGTSFAGGGAPAASPEGGGASARGWLGSGGGAGGSGGGSGGGAAAQPASSPTAAEALQGLAAAAGVAWSSLWAAKRPDAQ